MQKILVVLLSKHAAQVEMGVLSLGTQYLCDAPPKRSAADFKAQR